MRTLLDRITVVDELLRSPELERRQKVRRRIAWLLAVVCLFSTIVLAARPWLRIGFNSTSSLPGLIYVVFPQQRPRSGELIAFYPPANRYYRRGQYFVKQVRGTGGDVVSRNDRQFFINSLAVAVAKTAARDGSPLKLGPVGVIPNGWYWVWTPHPDSFDSRYADVGWIAPDRVLGRAVRLF